MAIVNNMTSNERPAVRKGEQTRAAILDVALEVAARDGLEGVTIGILADRLSMSKSGVFSHFGSREELLIATLKEYEVRFLNDILKPAVTQPRGLSRLKAILGNWFTRLGHENEQGCLYISGGVEYDGPDCLRASLSWRIPRACARRTARGCARKGSCHSALRACTRKRW